MVAVRQRHAGQCAGGLRGADARNHLEGHAGLHQRLGLLAAATKDIGVTALQAHQRAPRQGQTEHQLDDGVLLE